MWSRLLLYLLHLMPLSRRRRCRPGLPCLLTAAVAACLLMRQQANRCHGHPPAAAAALDARGVLLRLQSHEECPSVSSRCRLGSIGSSKKACNAAGAGNLLAFNAPTAQKKCRAKSARTSEVCESLVHRLPALHSSTSTTVRHQLPECMKAGYSDLPVCPTPAGMANRAFVSENVEYLLPADKAAGGAERTSAASAPSDATIAAAGRAGQIPSHVELAICIDMLRCCTAPAGAARVSSMVCWTKGAQRDNRRQCPRSHRVPTWLPSPKEIVVLWPKACVADSSSPSATTTSRQARSSIPRLAPRPLAWLPCAKVSEEHCVDFKGLKRAV